MKTKIYFLFPVLLAFALSSAGQSISITSRRIEYERPRPANEEKAKVTIEYPIVKAATRSLSRKIGQIIGFSRVFNIDLKQELNGDDQWLEAAGYDVDVNKNGILCVNVWMSGTGQFWSTFNRPVVVDLKTGKRVTAGMVFKDMAGLVAVVKKHQQAEIAQAKIDISKTEGYSNFDTGVLFETADFTVQNLREFAVTSDGLVFRYDHGFPRIMWEIQPQGVYIVPWSEARPFIRCRGLLGKFVC